MNEVGVVATSTEAPMTVFDDLYLGTPPWEIGRPQSVVVDLAETNGFSGRILDVGCGTGDNSIFLARRGHDVVGIDVSERAIEHAIEKCAGAERCPRFLMADALELHRLNTTFDTVLDCGFFHTLTDDGRTLYLQSLGEVMPPGGVLHIVCFSDDEPDWGGPRRISRSELETLGSGFFLEELAAVRFETVISDAGAAGWRASYSFGGRGPTTLQ